MIFSIMTKKLWGTGEVRNPKGELKNGVYQPPQEFLAKLTKEKVKLSNDARKVLEECAWEAQHLKRKLE